jgi:hypothetical protein
VSWGFASFAIDGAAEHADEAADPAAATLV